MNSSHLPEFVLYWFEGGLPKFIRVFWYFIFFELTRYLFFDYFIYSYTKIKSKFISKKWETAKNKLWLEQPFVSIIAPGKNEGKHLKKLIRSLSQQTYTNFEIIIVDDGSNDNTKSIGNRLLQKGLISKFIRNEQRGGKASAANLALQQSKGKYIVHIDADCSFDFDAIENILVPFYLDRKIGAVGGNVKVREYKHNICKTLQAIEYLKTVSVGRIVTSYLGIYKIVSGAFGAFEASSLKRFGGWDIGPGLDGDITVKYRKAGYKIYFSPKAICLTSVPDTFKKLSKQRMRWDKSLVRFRLRKHIDIFKPTANFKVLNFLSSIENIFFNLILNLSWWIYFLDICINFNSRLGLIIPMNITLYIVFSYVQMLVILLFSERRDEETYLMRYLWVMPFYTGYFLRIVRSYAYIKEFFFKSSYKDPWNPYKSSRQAKQMRI